jgi:uncharacterized protein
MTSPTSDTEVPAFWRGLGLPGLADIHVHFLPPRMLRRVWAHVEDTGQPAGASWPIIYKWSDAERIEHLRLLGVRMFTALAYAHQPGMAADLNAWTLDFATRHAGCVPSATFFPEPDVLRYTEVAIESGAKVFKVHLQVGDFDPNHRRLDPVWGLLCDTGVPVVLHVGSSPIRSVHTGPGPLGRLLRRHPRLPVVVAHAGAPEYGDFLELATRYERVAVDTAMAFTRVAEQRTPFPRAFLPQLQDLGLAGKVLLGSDFPNLPHPYADQLSALAGLNLGDDWLRAVCWENMSALLNARSRPDR